MVPIEMCILEAEYASPDEIRYVLTTHKDAEETLTTSRGEDLFTHLEDWLSSKLDAMGAPTIRP